MAIRNCIESDILKRLGGTDLQCQGTQREILDSIAVILGGAESNAKSRNETLEDILTLSQ